ncbi:apoptotic chromatin condensation inducer in the nucleus-like [Sinocyclocheilus rhinocerous]|uniref:apoptotic chromatin condensation inducer in the nucleus-like n=1 Tax=Sinocyclocheilus rhinocerous TaxID=307959 RepID=UPI0007B9D98E|nr:PREDICTED: apoptotic chromatin condensation inducer in the nucleus-like [Sinocyclocheilus rhinocerous]
MGFHTSVSPHGFECGFNPESNIKKEEEPGSLPMSLSVSDYLTPSWSLSPSSSPLSHSEASDSDREEDEEEEEEDEDEDDDDEEEDLRDRMMRCRKKRKTSATVKKKAQSRPLSFTCPAPSSPTPFQQPLAPPTTNINNNININIGAGGELSRRQHCPYCGRHFRSLARHLEKHHEQQPEVRAAMELSQLPNQDASSLPFSSPAQPSAALGTTSLFSRERDALSSPPKSGGVSFSLSLSPPPASSSSKKSSAMMVTPGKGTKKSPGASPKPPARRGRPPKKQKELPLKKQEEAERVKEEAPGKQEEQELDTRGDASAEQKNGEMASPGRSHMPPLLSSLSTLVLYLRRQQHSSFLSLSRAPPSAEAWRLLCHSSLALLILYNRHRECEVAKLTLQDYRSRAAPSSPSLDSSLSPFERAVLGQLPRVSVLGKRGRLQPLILPPHSEACLDLLLETSADVGVDPQSPYVFSRPYHSPATPLRGTDLLRSLARSSGAKNPATLTTHRARRQVAILTQLLLLEEGERAAKRLEDFLQREYHVTQSCARIGQDPALMNRVGRVVLYGEREGVLFRGMSLQHICLELDVMSGKSGDSFSEDSDAEASKSKRRAVAGKKEGPRNRAPRPKKSSGPHQSTAHKRRGAQVKSGQH